MDIPQSVTHTRPVTADPWLPSQQLRTATTLALYSFPVQLRVGGWVGLRAIWLKKTALLRKCMPAYLSRLSISEMTCLIQSINQWHEQVVWQAPSKHTQPFYGPFSGPPWWAAARRELLDFMVQGKINRGRHTNHPDRRHSIQTNQCPPRPSPIFYRPDAFLPPNQQHQSTEGN